MKKKNSALRVSPAQSKHYTELVGAMVDRLRKEQRQQGLSINGLASRVGLNGNSSIFKTLHRGSRRPTLRNLLRIADALNMDIEVRVTKRRRN